MNPPADDALAVRLRVSWGGGEKATWTGTIRPNDGQLEKIDLLSLADDAPGSVLLKEQAIQVAQKSATSYGGFDVTFRGRPEGSISVVLASVENPDRQFIRTIPVARLLEQEINEVVDSGNRVMIRRCPGDALQVRFSQPHLVFRAGEPIGIELAPRHSRIRNHPASCRIALTPARSSNVVWSSQLEFDFDKDGNAEPVRFQLPAPQQEGVYSLNLKLTDNGYQSPFSVRTEPQHQTVQLVVLSSNPVTRAGGNTNWREIGRLDAVAPEPQVWNLGGRADRWRHGNDHRAAVTRDGRSMLELGVGGWQVIPIDVDRSDAPLQVEIEIEDVPGTSLGFSILQLDGQNQVSQFGFDSGLSIPGSSAAVERSETGMGIQKHRFPFWANGDRVFLLMANRSERQVATLGQVRVLRADTPPPSNDLGDQVQRTNQRRKLLAFYEKPMFARNFAATGYLEPRVDQPLDDWVTFYEGAKRFIHYLKANSYQGGIVTVVSDGSSIYPSRLLAPTPKFDTGIFFENAQDPIRKDILELLFRMFEREGLVLIPAVCFNQPLPQVEFASDPEAVDDQTGLVDFRGVSHAGPASTNLPIYNPLDPRVQGAVIRVIGELAARYREHASFDGVAVVCRPDSYTMLPGRNWCYDQRTVRRFSSTLSREVRSQLQDRPAHEIRGRLQADLQEDWTRWRAAEMSNWYSQMLAAIRQYRPQGRLILSPVDIFRNMEASTALAPSLHLFNDFDRVMLELGFEQDLDLKHPGIVMMQPRRIAPRNSLAEQRVEISVRDSLRANEFFSQKPFNATLLAHRSDWAHFIELQSQPPFENQLMPLMRRQPAVYPENINRQRFTRAMRTSDARWIVDGGSLLSFGQEHTVRQFGTVFSALPNVAFETVSESNSANSPVICRQARIADQLFFYVVNDSPWPVRTEIRIAGKDLNEFQPMGRADQEFSSRIEEGQLVVELELAAFDMVAGSSHSADATVAGYQYWLPPKFDESLRNRLRIVQSRLNVATQTPQIDVLQNPDFFDGNEQTLLGWFYGNQPTARVRLDAQQQQNDPGSLLLANEDQPAVWVRSNPFPLPKTGRLTISAWLKTDRNDRQPQVRIAIEGNSPDLNYYRFGSIGTQSSIQDAKRINQEWQRFAVHFDDLPTRGLEHLRVGFDLMGPGRVWIDNVQVYDRWLDENDAKAITQLLATASRLLDRQETADQSRRILHSYWPRFLLEHFSFDQESHSRVPEKTGADNGIRNADLRSQVDPAAVPTGDRAPGLLERFKSMVPQRVLPFR